MSEPSVDSPVLMSEVSPVTNEDVVALIRNSNISNCANEPCDVIVLSDETFPKQRSLLASGLL